MLYLFKISDIHACLELYLLFAIMVWHSSLPIVSVRAICLIFNFLQHSRSNPARYQLSTPHLAYLPYPICSASHSYLFAVSFVILYAPGNTVITS